MSDMRLFERSRDFPAMSQLISAVNRHDALDWLPSAEELALDWAPGRDFEPERDAVVIDGDDGLFAAGWVDWVERDGKIVHTVEIWVQADHRRRGLGRRVLSWLEEHAHATVAEGMAGSASLPHVLGGGVITSNAAAVAFAAATGYATIRYGFQMRRPLDLPIPEVALPDGLEVRPVLPEHHRAIWDADVEAFQDHWEARVRTEHDFIRTFTDPDFDPTMWQVAWSGDEVAGSIFNTIYPDQNARTGIAMGWLDHVSVRREWRGRGLASALVVRSLAIHRERGMDVAALGVDAENPNGALGLYEKYGFRPHYTWALVRKPF
jgi:mycothiol synthase